MHGSLQKGKTEKAKLTGLLLNKIRLSLRISNLILLIILLFSVFSVYYILDILIETNIRLAQIESLKFIVSVFISIIIFGLSVFLVSKDIKKDFSFFGELLLPQFSFR